MDQYDQQRVIKPVSRTLPVEMKRTAHHMLLKMLAEPSQPFPIPQTTACRLFILCIYTVFALRYVSAVISLY